MGGFFDRVKNTYNNVKKKISEKYSSAVKKGGNYASNLSEKLGKAKEELQYIGRKHGEHVVSAGAGAGTALGVVYRKEIAEGLRGIYEAVATGGEKVTTLGQVVRDISYAASIPTGVPQFFAGVAVGATGAELYERGVGKEIKKAMKTRKSAIAKECGKEAAEVLDEIYEQIREIERQEKEFNKAYNRASVKGLKGASEMKRIVDEYEQFRKENAERYENLVNVVEEFNKQYNAVARGKSFDVPTISRNTDGSYSISTIPLDQLVQEKIVNLSTEYSKNLRKQAEILDKIANPETIEKIHHLTRKVHYSELPKLETEASRLKEELEIAFAQQEAIQKRKFKQKKKK